MATLTMSAGGGMAAEGGAWCGSGCLTPLPRLLEEGHPNLQEDKDRMDREIRRGKERGKYISRELDLLIRHGVCFH